MIDSRVQEVACELALLFWDLFDEHGVHSHESQNKRARSQARVQASDFICIFFRMIDSAQAYDEEQVGEAVQESGIPREDVFIVSKVHPRFLGYDETLKSVEESLTKLKVFIILTVVHFTGFIKGQTIRNHGRGEFQCMFFFSLSCLQDFF